MLVSYFTLAYRLLFKNKFYILVNILSLGVAIGIAIIAYWVHQYNDEFNAYFKDGDQILRLHQKAAVVEEKDSPTITAENFASFRQAGQQQASISRYQLQSAITSTTVTYKNSIIAAVDDSFFDIFSFDYVHPPLSSQMRPNWIILTKQLAERMFGTENPMGQTLQVEIDKDVYAFMVAAVLEDIPRNTSLWFDALILFSSYDFYEYKQPKEYDAVFYRSKSDSLPNFKLPEELYPVSLTELHHIEDRMVESKFNGVITGQGVRTAIMALVLILLSAFNFTNTSIASAAQRLKEIGIRKVVGATRRDLFRQLLVENFAVVFTSIFIGIAFSEYFIQIYNNWWETMRIKADFNDTGFYIYIFFLGAVLSLLACVYPAFYISGFSPSVIFQGKFKFDFNRKVTRVLLIGQFSITAYLVFMLSVFLHNYYFQKNFDRGYRYTKIVNVRAFNLKHYLGMASALKREFPKIRYCGTNHLIGFHNSVEKYDVEGLMKKIVTYKVSYNYPRFLEMKLKSGRWQHINKKEVVVNEQFVEEFGETDEVLYHGQGMKIVGIVKDFSPRSLQKGQGTEPAVLRLIGSDEYRYLSVKFTNEDPAEMEKVLRYYWTKNLKNRVFRAFSQEKILDFEKMVNSILLKLNAFLSVVAILISMLGIYTLVSMSIIKRSVEIGVRKTFGAMTKEIINLINFDYIVLVVGSVIIGTAGGYFAAEYFLNFVFESHAPISFWTFFSPLLVVFVIVVLSVFWKIIGTAKQPPVRFLKDI